MWVVGGFCGYGGSVWVMGEWAVGQWIVGVTSFQKIFGLCGLKCHIVEIWRDVTPLLVRGEIRPPLEISMGHGIFHGSWKFPGAMEISRT